ncbi:hypothetical protein D9756_008919 [Leucocoprinus leucothites]|uniref:Uncharacterized protein n=1 Tax=Leucocoprinus leucothites TaxID=201217 RepID=A0A8H5CYI5_9AGAR|nr:hypothetical protein D9756_008919 [Leucoagaricus leucothites]
MDFLKNLTHDDTKPEGQSKPAPTQSHEEQTDNLLERFANKLHIPETPELTQPPPPPPAPEDKSLFEKLGDQLSGEDTKPPTPPQTAKHGHESIFNKIGDAVDNLSGKPASPPPPPPAPAKSENIFDKIGDAFSGERQHAPPPPPPKPEGIFDKISDALRGGKHEQPQKPQTLGDKIGDKVNNAFGGGARGEAQEDHLDKAIDFVQEHVLKEGAQSNESAFEQAKDERIAGVLRHVIGKEKKDNE